MDSTIQFQRPTSVNIKITMFALLKDCNKYKSDAGINGMIFLWFTLQGCGYLHCIAPKSRMISWKGFGKKRSWPNQDTFNWRD